MKSIKYWLGSNLLVLSLFGCFESKDLDSNNDYEPKNIHLRDSLVLFAEGQLSPVDLTNGVTNSTDYTLVSATLDDGSNHQKCQSPMIVNNKIMMQVEEGTICKINYSMSSAPYNGSDALYQGARRANSDQSIHSQSSVYLIGQSLVVSGTRTPILQAMSLEFGSKPQTLTVDLATYFPDVPSAFTLDINSLVVIGAGTATASGTTITFDPEEEGLTRVLYTLVSVVDPADMEIGNIDISVTDNVNKGLELTVPHYQFPDRAYIGKTIDFDVSHFVAAVDSDFFGDDFGLVDVMDSIGSTITFPKDADLYNKQFSFTPHLAGPNWLAYQVDDYRGSRVVGTILVNVMDQRTANWGDISLDTHQRFMAPVTENQASTGGFRYFGSFQEQAYLPDMVEVATFDASQAKDYCSAVAGQLPTVAQLDALYLHIAASNNSDNWPIEKEYLSGDSGYPILNLETGAQTSSQSGEGYYVTCIQDPSFIVTSSAGRPGSLQSPAIVQTTLSDGLGNPISNTRVGLALSLDPLHAVANASCIATQQTSLTDSNGIVFGYVQTADLSGGSCYLEVVAEELEGAPSQLVEVKFAATSAPTLTNITMDYTPSSGVGSNGIMEAVVACTGCSGNHYYLFEINGVPKQIGTNRQFSLGAGDEHETISLQVMARNSYCDYTIVNGNDCKAVTGKTSVKIKSSGTVDICQTYFDILDLGGPDISNPNCGL